jgi:disintegrin/metalloproteinase domain-containing protein 1
MLEFRIPGLPDWANLVVLVVGLMIVLAWVLMPFSVFGVKGRIEEIRQLNIRLAQGAARAGPDYGLPAEAPTLRRAEPVAMPEPRAAPPIPPPPVMPERATRPAAAPPFRPDQAQPGQARTEPTLPPPSRAEPKLSWPPRG